MSKFGWIYYVKLKDICFDIIMKLLYFLLLCNINYYPNQTTPTFCGFYTNITDPQMDYYLCAQRLQTYWNLDSKKCTHTSSISSICFKFHWFWSISFSMISVECRRMNYATSSTHTQSHTSTHPVLSFTVYFFFIMLLLLLLSSSVLIHTCESLPHLSQSICAIEYIFLAWIKHNGFICLIALSWYSQDHRVMETKCEATAKRVEYSVFMLKELYQSKYTNL